MPYSTSSQKHKILVIEDNKADAVLIEYHLSNSGVGQCDFTFAETLEQATDILLISQEYAIIFLDINLPDSNGMETLLSVLRFAPDSNVVVLTGHADRDFGLATVANGAQDYIVKEDLDGVRLGRALLFSIERNRILSRLEESQRIAQLGHWEFNLKTHTYTASKEAKRIFGLSESDNIFKFRIRKHINDKDSHLDINVIINQLNKTGRYTQTIEINNDTIGKRYLEMSCRPFFDEENTMVSIRGIIQDITRLKSLEKENQERQKRIENIFKHSTDGLYTSTLDGQFLEFNNAICRITGYSTEELKQLNIKSLYPKNVNRNEILNKLTDGSSLSDFPIDCVTKSGDIRNCLLSTTKIITKEFSGFQGVIRDITDKKKAEEEKQKREVAEKAAQMKERFLASVTHEMRTPMNAVLGMSHLLLQTSLNNEQTEFVSSIKHASENLLSIINDILEISQLQHGSISLHKSDFSPALIFNTVKKAFDFKAQEKNIEFKLNIDDSMPDSLFGDKGRLTQILNNLLGNAFKFTEKGAITVNVQTKRGENSKVALLCKVQDTGLGIPEDKLNAIFETFTQVDRSDSNKIYEGTGLGLAITKQLIEKQNGTIQVSSKVNIGSEFTFEIPFELPKTTSKKAIKVHEIPEINNTILLAEDNKMNQIVAKKILENQWPKSKVLVAQNGQEAIDLEHKHKPDLILMDIQMPVMDGNEATSIIKKNNPELPIIALTAHAYMAESNQYLNYGYDDILLKPINPENLFSIITKHITQSS